MKNLISTVGNEVVPGTETTPYGPPPGTPPSQSKSPPALPAPQSDSNEKLYYALAGGIAGLVFGYLMAYQSPSSESAKT